MLILFIPLIFFAEEDLGCEKSWTTLAINQCMHKDLVEAENVMDKYLAKSLERYLEDNVSVASIKKWQEAWLHYKNEHCGAVYDIWSDGLLERRWN